MDRTTSITMLLLGLTMVSLVLPNGIVGSSLAMLAVVGWILYLLYEVRQRRRK